MRASPRGMANEFFDRDGRDWGSATVAFPILSVCLHEGIIDVFSPIDGHFTPSPRGLCTVDAGERYSAQARSSECQPGPFQPGHFQQPR